MPRVWEMSQKCRIQSWLDSRVEVSDFEVSYIDKIFCHLNEYDDVDDNNHKVIQINDKILVDKHDAIIVSLEDEY